MTSPTEALARLVNPDAFRDYEQRRQYELKRGGSEEEATAFAEHYASDVRKALETARAILASGYALPAESGEYGHLVANALARMNGRVDVMTFNERSEHGGGFSTHAEVRCVGDNEREQSQVAWCCDEEDARVIASIPAMARAISSLSAEREAAARLASLSKALLDDANAGEAEALDVLAELVDDACSLGCPSTGREGVPIPHTERCNRARALLADRNPDRGVVADLRAQLATASEALKAMEDEDKRADEALDIQRVALLNARAVFQEYVRLHRAENPPDEAKAKTNFAHADAIGTALAAASAALRPGDAR